MQEVPSSRKRDDLTVAQYSSFVNEKRVLIFGDVHELPSHDEEAIVLAEKALVADNISIARSLVTEFFRKDPQKNQFFCRAKIVLAHIIFRESIELTGVLSIGRRRDALDEILIALEIATTPLNIARYQFLVYNAALAFWSIARSMLRAGRAKQFTNYFEKVSNALEAQNDSDRSLRIEFLSAAAFCFNDDSNSKSATDFVDKAVSLQEALYAATRAEEQRVGAMLHSTQRRVDELLSAVRAIDEREELLRKPRKIDPDLPLDDEYYTRPLQLPELTGLAAQGRAALSHQLDGQQADKSKLDAKLKKLAAQCISQVELLLRLHRERIFVNVADAKRYLTLPNVTQDLRMSSMLSIQAVQSGAIVDKDVEPLLNSVVKKLEDAKSSESRNETLLDVARTCFQMNFNATAIKCLTIAAQSTSPASRLLRIKTDICEAQRIMAEMDEFVFAASTSMGGQLLTSVQMDGIRVARRLEASKLLEHALSMSVTVAQDSFLVEEICIILWNVLYVLLTDKLRMKAHNPLKAMASALDSLRSESLPMLRSQILFELALCEDAADYSALAQSAMRLALHQDFGDVDASRVVPFEQVDSKLDENRARDQFLRPALRALDVRVDVYNTPSLVDEQVVLWCAQARDSTAKAFVLDMLTKSLFLLLREQQKPVWGFEGVPLIALQDKTSTQIDWTLEIMKFESLFIAPIELGSALELLQSNATVEELPFSFAVNLRISNLVSIAELAYAAQDFNLIQNAIFHVLRVKWNTNQVHGPLLMEDQVKCCCYLAESFVLRLRNEQQYGDTFRSTRRSSNSRSADMSINDASSMFATGIVSTLGSDDIHLLKKLVVLSLQRGLQIAMELKDVFATQNVLVYFWNLHIHVFRASNGNNDKKSVVVMDEIVEFLKFSLASFEQIAGFPGSDSSLDPKLFVLIAEALADIQFRKDLFSDALQSAQRGLAFSLPGISSGHSTNAYLRKSLVELASLLNVINIQRGASVNTKAKDAPVLGPIYSADNALLNLFSALSVAEMSSGTTTNSSVATSSDVFVPKEVVDSAFDRAVALLSTEVITLTEKEDEAEKLGRAKRIKENAIQRLEMLLEGYSRLARLRILRLDYVGAQNLSEMALKRFYNDPLTAAEQSNNWDSASSNLGSKVLRWISKCEQSLSLTIAAFLEASLSANATGLDNELIVKLSEVSLQHLSMSVQFAVRAEEETIAISSGSLSLPPLSRLLASDLHLEVGLSLGQDIVASLRNSKSRSQGNQLVLRDLFVSMSSALVSIKDYDRALQMLKVAFSSIDSELQRDLWPIRVVCMSRKGLNVLDGLQKLKEKDPLLQSRVLVLFARSSNDLKTKLSVFMQAIDMLSNDVASQMNEKVDYLLELVEIMSAFGVPRSELRAVLSSATSILATFEEAEFDSVKDWDEEDDQANSNLNKNSSLLSAGDRNSSKPKSVMSSRSATRGSSAQTTSRKSVANKSVAASTRSASLSTANAKSMIALDAVPEAQQPGRLTFRGLEQAFRSYIMEMSLETSVKKKESLLREVFYYVKRSLEMWIGTLQFVYKRDRFYEADGQSRPHFSEFSVNYPTHLIIPESIQEVFSWSNNLDIQRSTLTAIVNERKAVQNLDELQRSAVISSLPSLLTVQCFSATVFQLIAFIRALADVKMFEEALYCVAFARLMLWSTLPLSMESDLDADGKSSAIPSDRELPLLFLQLLTMNIVSKMGRRPTDLVGNADFVLAAGAARQSAASTLARMISRANSFHLRSDLNRSELFDLSYQSLLAQLQLFDGQNSFSSPFEIESTGSYFESIGSLDSSYFEVQICEQLIDLQQLAVAEQLVTTLMTDQRSQMKSHRFTSTLTLFMHLLVTKREFRKCIVLSIKQRELFQFVGDCRVFTAHFLYALQSYFALNSESEATELYSLATHLLRDLSKRQIERYNVPPSASSSSLNVSKSGTLSGSPSRVTVVSTTSPNAKPAMEMGVEYLDSWRSIALCFIKLSFRELVSKIRSMLFSCSTKVKFDPLSQFADIVRIFDMVMTDCQQFAGESSELEAELRELRASLTLDFVATINSICYQLNIENWVSVRSDQIDNAVDDIDRVLSIAQHLYNRFSENGTVENKDGHSLVDPFVVDLAQAPSTVPLSSVPFNQQNAVRTAAVAEFNLAHAMITDSVLQNNHVSATDFDSLSIRSSNVIDKYLEDTEFVTEIDANLFDTSQLLEIQQKMTVACSQLKDTKYETYAEIAALTALIFHALKRGCFDCNWLSADKQELVAALKYASVDAVLLSQIQQLVNLLEKSINSDYRQFESILFFACIALLESFGSRSAKSAGRILLWMQSLSSKWSLMDYWSSSLNPKSEIKSALQKLDLLLQSDSVSINDQKSVRAVKAVLGSSISYQRLSIDADPLAQIALIEQQHPDTAVLCIQLCSMQRHVYMTCYKPAKPVAVDPIGKPGKGAPAAPAAPAVVPITDDSWVFDKMKLTEENRRALQILNDQQREWQSDWSKFVSVNGEHLSCDADDTQQSPRASSLGLKQERALEERFRAISQDLETLLSPLLGNDSCLGNHLAKLEGKSSLLILLDPILSQLPFEALAVINKNFSRSTHRDFSIHMFAHRLKSSLSGSSAVVQASAVRFLVDPLQEDNQLPGKNAPEERSNLLENFSNLVKSLSSASKWTKLRSSEGIVSQEDFLSLDPLQANGQTKCNAFIVNCFGRLGNFFSPRWISAMNLSKISLIMCLENAHCENSFRRQNSEDVLKLKSEIDLESSFKMAALLSLAGCSTVVTAQWTTPLRYQHQFMRDFMTSFSDPRKDKIVRCFDRSLNSDRLKKTLKYASVIYGLSNATYADT